MKTTRRIIFYLGFVSFLFLSCKKEPEKQAKKSVNLFYVILDKSSNSYSDLGGKEENYIDLDTIYLQKWIDALYGHINQCSTKNDLILFFNYVDKDSKGNKELYLKIPAFETLDSTYRTKIGQIESNKKQQALEFKKEKQKREKQIALYTSEKRQLLTEIAAMLSKSKVAKGSDCSGALKTANQKLTNYLEIKKENQVKSKTIIAFSDLVNFPTNNNPVTIDFNIIRPGFTSDVTYLKNRQCVNVTTQSEFQELIFNLLDN